jgi:hypothetical protein
MSRPSLIVLCQTSFDSIIQIRLSNAICPLSFRYPYIYLFLDLGVEDLAGQTTILSF